MLKLSALRSGGTVYAVGRGVSVAWQIVLTAVVARVLGKDDLGRYTVAFATANLVGMFCGLSIRRLAMYRDEGADLSDLKVAVVLAGLVGVGVSFVACAIPFGSRTGMLALEVAMWRAADAYAEIGQGIMCIRQRLKAAGTWVGFRTAIPGAVITALIFFTDLTVAFAVGAAIRWSIAVAETHVPAPQSLRVPSLKAVWSAVGSGFYISLINGAILLVDTGPTFGIAKAAGLADVSLLAPLGRVRYGMTIAASTLGEIFYGEMVLRNSRPLDVLKTAMKPIRLYVLMALALGSICAAGGAGLIFGPLLHDRVGLVLLAVAAGTMMGFSTIISSGLTAQHRIAVQLLGFGIAGLLAVGGTWLEHWRIDALYTSQVVAGVVSILVFLALGYRVKIHEVVAAISRRDRSAAPSDGSSGNAVDFATGLSVAEEQV